MVHTLGWLGMAGSSPAHSGFFQFILGEFGAIWLVLVTPWVHHSFFTTDLDEGNPTGCLVWSPMGGRSNIHVPHIEEGVEPLMVAPVLCSRCSRWFQNGQTFSVFQVLQMKSSTVPVRSLSSRGTQSALEHSRRVWRVPEGSGCNWKSLDKTGGVWTSGGMSGHV